MLRNYTKNTCFLIQAHGRKSTKATHGNDTKPGRYTYSSDPQYMLLKWNNITFTVSYIKRILFQTREVENLNYGLFLRIALSKSLVMSAIRNKFLFGVRGSADIHRVSHSDSHISFLNWAGKTRPLRESAAICRRGNITYKGHFNGILITMNDAKVCDFYFCCLLWIINIYSTSAMGCFWQELKIGF